MEAEAACDATGRIEMDRQRIHPIKPSPKDSSFAEIAFQSQPDDAAMASEIAASPSTENRISFLDLPSEIRNSVYQDPLIYETDKLMRIPWDDLSQDRYYDQEPAPGVFPDLRQPPITRVNKQVRNETLPLFYRDNMFVITLYKLTKACDGPENDQNIRTSVWGRLHARISKARDGLIGDQDSVKNVRDMLHAFMPVPNNNLQANNLSFLSHLTFRLDILSSSRRSPRGLGFTMSDRELDCDNENEKLVQTAGLNWNSAVEVREALVMAIASSHIVHRAKQLLNLDLLRHRPFKKPAKESADLMCCISRECPQLTRYVLAFIVGGDRYYNSVEYAMRHGTF